MLNIRELPPRLAMKARNELNEDEELQNESVKELREWIVTQPHLNGRTDDQFLILYLRTCKYRMEIVKQKIDMFYTIRTAMPEYFLNRNTDDPEMQNLIKLGVYIPLSQMENEDDPQLLLIRPGVFDPQIYKIQDIFKALTLILDIHMEENDIVPIAGVRAVVDVSNMSFWHILQYDPIFMKKIATFLQDSSGIRFKGIHLVNVSQYLAIFINVVKRFMNEKNRSRIFTHGCDFDALYKVVPQRLLPQEYGGEVGSISDILNNWIEKVKSYSAYLSEQDQYCVDENKRPRRRFSFWGSFRKADINK